MDGQNVLVENQVHEKRPGVKLENLETNGDSEREAFRKCLDRSGVTESLVKTVEALMLEAVFPQNPMLFVTQFLSDRYVQPTSSNFVTHAPSQLHIPTNHSLLRPKEQSNHSYLKPKEPSNHSLLAPNEQSNHSLLTPKEQSNHSLLTPKEQSNHSLLTPKEQSSHSSLMPIEQRKFSLLKPKEDCNYSLPVHKEKPQLVTEGHMKPSASFGLPHSIASTTLTLANSAISFYGGSVKTSVGSPASFNDSAISQTNSYSGSVKSSIGNSTSLIDYANTSVSVSTTTSSYHDSVKTSCDKSLNALNDSDRTLHSIPASNPSNGSSKNLNGAFNDIPFNPNIGPYNTDNAPLNTNPVFGPPHSNLASGAPKSSMFNNNGEMPKNTNCTFNAHSGTPYSTNGIPPDPPSPFKHLSHLRLPLMTSPLSPPIAPPSPYPSRHSIQQRRDGSRNSLSKAPGSFRRVRNNLPSLPEEISECDTSHLAGPDGNTTDVGSELDDMASTQTQDGDQSKSNDLGKSTEHNEEAAIVAKKDDITSNTDNSLPAPLPELDTSPQAPPNSPDSPKLSVKSALPQMRSSDSNRTVSTTNALNLATSLAEKKHLLTKIYHQKQAAQRVQIKERIKQEPPRDASCSDLVADLNSPPPPLQNPALYPHNTFPSDSAVYSERPYPPCISQSSQMSDRYPSAPHGVYPGTFIPPNISYQQNGPYPPQSGQYSPVTFSGPFPNGPFQNVPTNGPFQNVASSGPPNAPFQTVPNSGSFQAMPSNGPFQSNPVNALPSGPFPSPSGGSVIAPFQPLPTSGPAKGPYPVNNFVLTGPNGFSVPISGPYSNVFTTNPVTSSNQGWIQPPPVSFNDPSLHHAQGSYNGQRESKNKKRKS